MRFYWLVLAVLGDLALESFSLLVQSVLEQVGECRVLGGVEATAGSQHQIAKNELTGLRIIEACGGCCRHGRTTLQRDPRGESRAVV